MPKEASLWAMSRQDPQRQCPVQSLQQRQAARKAARSGAPSAQAEQPRQDAWPVQACVPELEKSADSTSNPEQSSTQAGGSAAQRLDQDVQLLSSDTSCRAGECAVQGAALASAEVHAGRMEGPSSRIQTGLARDMADSNKALRVQSLRQELAAAEAVVAELKSWLADAEAELEE